MYNMAVIYFVRHGESEGNKNRIHQDKDVPLSREGKRQARVLAKRLKEKGIEIIYSSPYLRAKQTAKIIAEKLNVPIKYLEDLKERRSPSELNGLRYDDPKALRIKEIISKNESRLNWKFSDEESLSEVLARAKKVENYLLKQQSKFQNILCISHVKIMFMIILQILFKEKLTPKIFWQFYYHSKMDNTGITQLEFTKEFGWRLVTWNDVNHL